MEENELMFGSDADEKRSDFDKKHYLGIYGAKKPIIKFSCCNPHETWGLKKWSGIFSPAVSAVIQDVTGVGWRKTELHFVHRRNIPRYVEKLCGCGFRLPRQQCPLCST